MSTSPCFVRFAWPFLLLVIGAWFSFILGTICFLSFSPACCFLPISLLDLLQQLFTELSWLWHLWSIAICIIQIWRFGATYFAKSAFLCSYHLGNCKWECAYLFFVVRTAKTHQVFSPVARFFSPSWPSLSTNHCYHAVEGQESGKIF